MQTENKPLLELILAELRYRNKVSNQLDLGVKLEYGKGYISTLMKSTEPLPFKVQTKLADIFGINKEWLASNGKEGSMFGPAKTTGDDLRKKKAFGTSDDEEPGLIYVPIAAQAGYTRNFSDPIYINQLDRLYIPGLPYKGDKYRYFDIEGDSMSPTIEEGMQVIGELVEPEDWQFVHDYYIYVIVLQNLITIKRVFKKSDTQLVIISDNDLYPQQLIKMADIKEMWYVKRILDWRMPPPKQIKITV